MTVRSVMTVVLKLMVMIDEDHDEGRWNVKYVSEPRGVSNVDDSPLQALSVA